ncbi:hypothetical protein RRF57_009073 [Xylaria bambusicola]|uniref:Uncharacterized protein n=1 Tax=Xylaria bambusicola TaxID=326684 RepID=A0AAN7UYY5_9PEZI
MASASTTSAELAESVTDYTRLHITPFDLSLQSVVIPASVLPRARNISYHTIETFPEKRFGFVDLPIMDADKLKKKLNGAVLKGTKIRVETARPESTPQSPANADTTDAKKEKRKKSKKRKHEADVVEGVQLDGRKVKRGWTTTEQEMIEEKRKKARKDKKEKQPSKDEKKDKKDKKKRATVKSKYTDEPECLFKTKLPTGTPSAETKADDDGESSSQKKARHRRGNREVIVHEFEKTTKYPTFLKSNSTGAGAEATTFEDGIGWVDSNGNVVEPVKSRRRPEVRSAPPPAKPEKTIPTTQEEAADEDEDDDKTSSSGSSLSDEDDDTSSSGSDSEIPDKSSKIVNTPKKLEVETPGSSSPSTAPKPDSARPKSSGSITSLSIKIPPATPSAKKIHPLEALYKRPRGGEGESNGGSEAKPFSFFGNEDDIEDEDSTIPMSQAPMTPFTKQEFEFRNIRSAAPTPDTAHPSRSFNFWASQDSVEDAGLDEGSPTKLDDVAEEQDGQDEDVEMEGNMADEPSSQTPASDFQKQFWESRGDLNRAWRKRRKAAAKEKRYRENRARAERAI